MIKVLQQKLLASGYVTNTISDKGVRHEINIILQEGIKTYGENVMLIAIDRFAEIYKGRSGEKINKKVPYFRKLLKQTLKEAQLPDNDFAEIVIDETTIRETIIQLIERAVIISSEETAYNPLKEKPMKVSPFPDIPDELYQTAYRTMLDYDYYFAPLIERALKLNDDYEGSIKDEIDSIYEELEKFTENYAYESLMAKHRN